MCVYSSTDCFSLLLDSMKERKKRRKSVFSPWPITGLMMCMFVLWRAAGLPWTRAMLTICLPGIGAPRLGKICKEILFMPNFGFPLFRDLHGAKFLTV